MDRAKPTRAIVTGGAGGIGLAVAKAFLADGMSIVLVDCSEDALRAASAELGDNRGRVGCAVVDVRQRRDVEVAFDEAWAAFGGVDTLVNCAGGGSSRPALEITDEDWDQVVDSNLKGTFLCSQAFARSAVQAGAGGSIVNISSTAATVARPSVAHYAAAKAGINQMTKVLAIELAPHNIRVNAVCPGIIATARGLALAEDESDEHRTKLSHVPLARLGTAEEVAAMVAFLVSPAASFVTGETVSVDGGYHCGIARYASL